MNTPKKIAPTPAELSFERELRELWRPPPVTLPCRPDGEPVPAKVEEAMGALARYLAVPRRRTLELWASVQRAAKRVSQPTAKGGGHGKR